MANLYKYANKHNLLEANSSMSSEVDDCQNRRLSGFNTVVDRPQLLSCICMRLYPGLTAASPPPRHLRLVCMAYSSQPTISSVDTTHRDFGGGIPFPSLSAPHSFLPSPLEVAAPLRLREGSGVAHKLPQRVRAEPAAKHLGAF